MTYACFDLVVEDRVAHLTMRRPAEMNTLNAAWFRELRGIVAALHGAKPARALVISSTGRHFTAGMALEVFTEGGSSTPTARRVAACSASSWPRCRTPSPRSSGCTCR